MKNMEGSILAVVSLCFGLTCVRAEEVETTSDDMVKPELVDAQPAASTEQPAQPESLTLDQALDLAAMHHPDHAFWRAQADAAEGRAHQVSRLPNPSFSGRIESAPFRGKTLGEAEYLAGFSQEIPTAGKLSKARRVEELDRERLMREQSAGWVDIRKRIHAAFATALYMNEFKKQYEQTLRSTEQGVTIAMSRQEAGDAAPGEATRAEMEVVRIKLESQKAQSLLIQAMTDLIYAIGDPSLQIHSVQGHLDTILNIPAIEELAAQLDRHPRIQAIEAEAEVNRARMTLAKAQRVPSVNFDLMYRRVEGERRDALDSGFSISIPLFDGGKGRIREAQANIVASEARARSTRVALEGQLRAAYQRLSRELTSANTIKNELLPRADQVFKTAESRYEGGDIGLSEILPLRRERAALHLDYLESLREVMLAWSELSSFIQQH